MPVRCAANPSVIWKCSKDDWVGLDWTPVCSWYDFWLPITADVSINFKMLQKSDLFGYKFI